MHEEPSRPCAGRKAAVPTRSRRDLPAIPTASATPFQGLLGRSRSVKDNKVAARIIGGHQRKHLLPKGKPRNVPSTSFGSGACRRPALPPERCGCGRLSPERSPLCARSSHCPSNCRLSWATPKKMKVLQTWEGVFVLTPVKKNIFCTSCLGSAMVNMERVKFSVQSCQSSAVISAAAESSPRAAPESSNGSARLNLYEVISLKFSHDLIT